MKTINLLLLAAIWMSGTVRAEEWRRVAFIGDAKVFKISGLVEVVAPKGRILREGEKVSVGETFKIWRGAALVLVMKNSESLVRAEGPVLLRLAPATEGYDRASLTGREEREGFIVRAVRGQGKFFDGRTWQMLRTGMSLPEGAKVRPHRDSTLDFYHPQTRTVFRVTDHKSQTTLAARLTDGALVAAREP